MGRILILSVVLVLAGCASSGDDGAPTTTTSPAAETTVVPEPQEALPDHLDRPLEVPEADAIEQALEVPVDDEDD